MRFVARKANIWVLMAYRTIFFEGVAVIVARVPLHLTIMERVGVFWEKRIKLWGNFGQVAEAGRTPTESGVDQGSNPQYTSMAWASNCKLFLYSISSLSWVFQLIPGHVQEIEKRSISLLRNTSFSNLKDGKGDKMSTLRREMMGSRTMWNIVYRYVCDVVSGKEKEQKVSEWVAR